MYKFIAINATNLVNYNQETYRDKTPFTFVVTFFQFLIFREMRQHSRWMFKSFSNKGLCSKGDTNHWPCCGGGVFMWHVNHYSIMWSIIVLPPIILENTKCHNWRNNFSSQVNQVNSTNDTALYVVGFEQIHFLNALLYIN